MSTEQMPIGPIYIGVLTPDSLLFDGMRELLERDERYRVVSLVAALHSCPAPLQIAVVDVASATHLDSLLKQLRRARPEMGILMLGPDLALDGIMTVIRSGARGYLPYAAGEKELRLALEVIQEGSIWAPRKALAWLLAQRSVDRIAEPELTRREEEVLRLLVQGRPNRQIAEALGLDEASIKAHLSRLMRKLGVKNRTALSMHALALQDQALLIEE